MPQNKSWIDWMGCIRLNGKITETGERNDEKGCDAAGGTIGHYSNRF